VTAGAMFAASRRYSITYDRVLTSAEVAAIARVSIPTVRRWAAEGKLRSARTPGRHGHRRYKEADVRALLGLEGGTP